MTTVWKFVERSQEKFVDHSKQFKKENENSLSRIKISRRMKEISFTSKRCAKKTLLIIKHINDIVIFASYYGKKEAKLLSNVIWSEESWFCFSSDRCTRRSNEKFIPNCIERIVKYDSGGIMVWGAVTAAGVGKHIRCDKLVNAKECIIILGRGGAISTE